MSIPLGFEPHHRFDFFEPGDKTALVCLDVPEMQRLAVEQLESLSFKMHTGLFMEDSILKLRAHPYDVIVVSEHFNGVTSPAAHPILREAASATPAVRRKQVYVLIGAGFTTNDELQAFAHSVDVVVGLKDLANLRPVLRRAVMRQQEFHSVLHETLHRVNTGKMESAGVLV